MCWPSPIPQTPVHTSSYVNPSEIRCLLIDNLIYTQTLRYAYTIFFRKVFNNINKTRAYLVKWCVIVRVPFMGQIDLLKIIRIRLDRVQNTLLRNNYKKCRYECTMNAILWPIGKNNPRRIDMTLKWINYDNFLNNLSTSEDFVNIQGNKPISSAIFTL